MKRSSSGGTTRPWRRFGDTHLDAIVTVVGNWKFAALPPIPKALMSAARRDMTLADGDPKS